MPDNKLKDNEIIKEIQYIRESMKRHIDLTNEMGQDLLRIDDEYTGGSKVWLTTDYFKKVVKHFCHSNYLVKCMELIFEYINRLQSKLIKEQNKNSKLRNERNRLQAENERLKKGWKSDVILTASVKAEAYKECIEKAKESIKNLEYNASTTRKTVKVEELKEQMEWVLHTVVIETLNNLLNELVGDKSAGKIND